MCSLDYQEGSRCIALQFVSVFVLPDEMSIQCFPMIVSDDVGFPSCFENVVVHGYKGLEIHFVVNGMLAWYV